MAWRTSTSLEGPYLVVTTRPSGSTQEQVTRAFEAAQQVFDDAGVDPVEAAWCDESDPERTRFLALWEAAERAATLACWAPRGGTPEPTKIEIYVE